MSTQNALTPLEQESLEVFQELREALFNRLTRNDFMHLMGAIRAAIVRLEDKKYGTHIADRGIRRVA